MDEDAIKAEIAYLEQLLRKRKGKSGFSDNVAKIEGCLAVLRGQLNG